MLSIKFTNKMDQVEDRLAGLEGRVVESRHSDNNKEEKWKKYRNNTNN